MKVFFPFLFICSLMQVKALDYTAYHRAFNYVDTDILSGDYASAIGRLDSIYTGYDFIYAKHCVKAMQVCCMAKDSFRAAMWMSRAFRRGVPLWFIRTKPG
jgi:hypothetical protein